MERASVLGVIAFTCVLGLTAVVACGSDRDQFATNADGGGGDAGESSGFIPVDGGFGGDVAEGLPPGETRDPVDCEEAKTSKSYVGCDYWPTVTPNAVWSIFDYAVVVANTGTKDASVTIELNSPMPSPSVWLTNILMSSLMRWSGLSAASP